MPMILQSLQKLHCKNMTTDSMVISTRLPKKTGERLKRYAKLCRRSPSEVSAMLVEEGLRRREFAFIDFRDTAIGRQAFLQGSRVSVWMAAKVVRAFRGHVEKAAAHLEKPVVQIQAAINYARAFPEEIEAAIEENDSGNFET